MPLAAYNVSGEFSMIKAAAEQGWIDERATALETLTGHPPRRRWDHADLLGQGCRPLAGLISAVNRKTCGLNAGNRSDPPDAKLPESPKTPARKR